MNDYRKQRQRLFEGLSGQSQEHLPPEEAKKAEEAVKSFLDENPTDYNLMYGSDRNDDSAYVGFHKHDDYGGDTGDVIVYKTSYKYEDSLHDLANRVWKKHQRDEYDKENPPVEINKDDALKRFDASSQHIDWYYDQSDDHRVWSAGNEKMKTLRNAMETAAGVDPNGAKEIVKKNFPINQQGWANNFIDTIIKRNRE